MHLKHPGEVLAQRQSNPSCVLLKHQTRKTTRPQTTVRSGVCRLPLGLQLVLCRVLKGNTMLNQTSQRKAGRVGPPASTPGSSRRTEQSRVSLCLDMCILDRERKGPVQGRKDPALADKARALRFSSLEAASLSLAASGGASEERNSLGRGTLPLKRGLHIGQGGTSPCLGGRPGHPGPCAGGRRAGHQVLSLKCFNIESSLRPPPRASCCLGGERGGSSSAVGRTWLPHPPGPAQVPHA